MVKKLSQLYMEARRALSQTEDKQTASLLARNLLCHVTGKTPEKLLSDLELYASQAVCDDMEAVLSRTLAGEAACLRAGTVGFLRNDLTGQ